MTESPDPQRVQDGPEASESPPLLLEREPVLDQQLVPEAASPPPQPEIPVAEPAPLAAAPRSNQVLGLPLQLLNQLLARLGSAPLTNLAELLPSLRLLALLLLAGFVLKLTGATLEALNEIPMLGRLLELVGLISAINFLARNALRSQKRAELLTRIQKLRQQFLG